MKAWMSWSSGKDSMLALHVARTELDLDVTAVLVSMNAEADRVSMHAVRRDLVEEQARRLGLPLVTVELPAPCPNEVYEEKMAAAIAAARADGVEAIVFGDLFLEDIRAYREEMLAGTGMQPVFPLWHRPTGELAREMVGAGIRAVLTCVDPAALPADFVGRSFDDALLADLPESVDACGERGEFHTFAWDGPGFATPIGVVVGEVVTRDGFVFADVLRSDERYSDDLPAGGPSRGGTTAR